MQLQIRGLSKTYASGVQVLKGVTLTLPVGVCGLLGHRGAGKSTLMRILALELEPDHGALAFGDTDLLADKDQARSLLGFLPQEPGAHPRLSAEALLGHYAQLRGMCRHWERREFVDSLLQATGIWRWRARALGSFPTDERQRFGVAVALLGNPKLLLLDEPTAGLDPAEAARFLELLGQLGQTRVVIFSTSRAADLGAACARVAILDRGDVVFAVEPELRSPSPEWRQCLRRSC